MRAPLAARNGHSSAIANVPRAGTTRRRLSNAATENEDEGNAAEAEASTWAKRRATRAARLEASHSLAFGLLGCASRLHEFGPPPAR